jgi:uncharacterized protein YfiM (DUF2279 family)
MKSPAVLLSTFVATLRSGFGSLPGILTFSLFYSTSTQAQIAKGFTPPSAEKLVTIGNPLNPGGFLACYPNDSSYFKLTTEQMKKRTWIIAGTQVLLYGGTMTALASAWYDNYAKTKLHAFDDSREWLQMDKVGHVYGSWTQSMANNAMWKWTGMERKKRIWISGLTSFAFQTTIEYLDGKSEKWGWSWADVGANIVSNSNSLSIEKITTTPCLTSGVMNYLEKACRNGL